MEPDRVEAAAAFLAARRDRATKIDVFPSGCAPMNEAEGYDIQAALHGLLAGQDQGRRVGWKIGCTTRTMQDYLAIDHPCAGGLFANRVFHNHGHVAGKDLCQPGVECEVAVTLGRSLTADDGPFDRAKVGSAVASLCAAIELVDNRYRDWSALGGPALVADDFFQAGAVLGPAKKDWRDLDLAALAGRMTVNGVSQGEGLSADILGHPLNALVWLADHVTGRGGVLPDGAVILLGSLVRTAWIAPGDRVEIAIDGLGGASLFIDP